MISQKFVDFLVFFYTTASFIAQISSFENDLKRDAILAPVAKTVSSQGYSELREPIKTRENCYSLILGQVLKYNNGMLILFLYAHFRFETFKILTS